MKYVASCLLVASLVVIMISSSKSTTVQSQDRDFVDISSQSGAEARVRFEIHNFNQSIYLSFK